jgi:hypothetical protein
MLGIKTPAGMWDNNYYYTDSEGWANVLLTIIKSDVYKQDKFDCENFAMKAMTKAAEYGLNTLCLAIGYKNGQRHAFNIFLTTDGFLLFEPQTGGIIPLNENYIVDEVYG